METTMNSASLSLTIPSKPLSLFREALIVIGASLLIGLGAQISIITPLSPVPFAITGHLCLLLGALLGPKRGAMVLIAYLLEGALGLPVFAMGKFGIATLLGPTGGYLVGFLVGTTLTGYLVSLAKTRWGIFASFLLGSSCFFLFGLPYLSLFIGLKQAIVVGLLPFIITDVLKNVLATKAYLAIKR